MKTILVIDDEAHIRKMLRKLLEKNGYNVLEADEGIHGLECFKEYGADLIITDIIMPEKQGLSVIKEIKEMATGVKIIAISGGGTILKPDRLLAHAEKLDADHAFRKPVDSKQLLLKIKQLLDE